jgi:hypothetical protein
MAPCGRSGPIEMADEPGAVGRKFRQRKKTFERAAPGRGKATRKAKGKKTLPKSAKRPNLYSGNLDFPALG